MGESNKSYAENNEVFLAACKLAHIKPCIRQASKFRSNYGKAYPFKKEAIKEIANDKKE